MARLSIDPSAALIEEARRSLSAKRFDDAERVIRQVLARQPDHFEGLMLLGLVAYSAHHYPDAVALMARALARRKGEPHHYGNYGLALHALGRFDEALRAFRRAVAGRPAEAVHHLNLANALRESGEPIEALVSFERALALNAELAGAHFGRALSLLSLGRIAQAWSPFEWRIQYAENRPYALDPRDPERVLPRPSTLPVAELRGKSVLVLGEQGLGDELFFLRYAPRLCAQGATIHYRGAAQLGGLLASVSCLGSVAVPGAALPPTDFTLLCGDLPLICARLADPGVPPALALTVVDGARQQARRLLADGGSPPYLALTWRAGNKPVAGSSHTLQKEVPLDALSKAVAGWRGTLVVVQRSPLAGEIENLKRVTRLPVIDLSACNADLELMLALLDGVDEYAGVSNTNTHLRAGLGRTGKVMVPRPAEWRWTNDAVESPWFPGFALFREQRGTGWQDALGRLARELQG